MAHWDGEKIVYWEPEPIENYPGWEWVDCGCCVGIKWGGEYPRECCCGDGMLALHKKSGRLSLYPGGPFCGRLTDKEVRDANGRLRTKKMCHM